MAKCRVKRGAGANREATPRVGREAHKATPPSAASASCGHFRHPWYREQPLQSCLRGGAVILLPPYPASPKRREKGWARSQGNPSPNTQLGLYRAPVIIPLLERLEIMSSSPDKGPGTHGVAGHMELGRSALPEQRGSPLPRTLFPRSCSSKAEGRGRTGQPNPACHGSPSAQQLPGDCGPYPHTTAPEGGIPTPKEGWHQGTPHHTARDVRREGTVPGSVRQRPVGGGLRPPLSPWVPLHHLTREQGRWANLSTFPTIFKPAEHRTRPCMVPAVSKQPGPGPRGPCRRQLGPAEGPR